SATRFWACAGKDNSPSNKRTVKVRTIIASLREPRATRFWRVPLTDFQIGKCSPAVGTDAAPEINGNSARPRQLKTNLPQSQTDAKRRPMLARSEMVLLHCMSPLLALLRHHQTIRRSPLCGGEPDHIGFTQSASGSCSRSAACTSASNLRL